MDSLFKVDYWDRIAQSIKIPIIKDPKKIDELHKLFLKFLPKGNFSFIEIGCAPGAWMAYFYKQFGYNIYGLEYSQNGYKVTIKNLKMLNIPNKVFFIDFLEFENHSFDIVFSYGFIEHFTNTNLIISKLASLCRPKGIIITIIPGFEDINWFISKVLKPKKAKGHYPIKFKDFIEFHLSNGFEKIYAGLYGSFIFRPISDNIILSNTIFIFIKLWNYVLSKFKKKFDFYPSFKFLNLGYIFIGEKKIKI